MPLYAEALPRAYQLPLAQGVLRTEAADFYVREHLSFEPTDEGEHVLLQIRKSGTNTEWLARQLARFAGVSPSAVAYAGRKDRHALTDQWFSIQLPGRDALDWAAFDIPDCQILQQRRHSRKLRQGAIQKNDFRCVLRQVQGAIEGLPERALRLKEQGVPNYFGPQRFGHDGSNLQLAIAWFEQGHKLGRKLDRNRRSLALSAARALLFNEVLAQRVTQATWNRILPGDALQLEGSRSYFLPEQINDELQQRLEQFDIHPSGPLWGQGELASTDVAAALEQAVAEHHTVLAEGLVRAGLKQERRALRLCPREMRCEILSEDTVSIAFSLPTGAFATTVLREWIDYHEAVKRA